MKTSNTILAFLAVLSFSLASPALAKSKNDYKPSKSTISSIFESDDEKPTKKKASKKAKKSSKKSQSKKSNRR